MSVLSIGPERRQGYLRISAGSSGSADFPRETWRGAALACERDRNFRVLCVPDSRLPLTLLDAMDHVQIFRDYRIDERYRIAWVEPDPYQQRTLRFGADLTGAAHLCVPRIFATEPDAVTWLLGTD